MTIPHGSRQPRPDGRRRGLVQWSPLLLTLVIGALAVATPKDFAVSRLLPAAPALAASMWSVGETVLLGVLTMVTTVTIQFALDEPATTFTVTALAAVTAAAAYAAHVRLARERTLTQVRSVADTAQAAVLRPVPHRLGGVGIETLYVAAAEEARIGGDFFEAVDTPYGVRVLLGDVRGKGLSAVGVASAITNGFREAAYDEAGLTSLARRLDASVSRYTDSLGTSDGGEGFATAILAEVHPDEQEVDLLNCGHPPPLLMRRGSAAPLVLTPSVPSPPLNMAHLIGADYTVDTLTIVPGDRLLFYTDGVTETRDRTGRFFPLADWVAQQSAVPAPNLLPLLHQRLVRFSSGDLDDDIAALVVHCDTDHDAHTAPGPSGATEAPEV